MSKRYGYKPPESTTLTKDFVVKVTKIDPHGSFVTLQVEGLGDRFEDYTLCKGDNITITYTMTLT